MSAVFLFLALAAAAPPAPKPTPLVQTTEVKNFYFLSLLEAVKDVGTDPALAPIAARRMQMMDDAVKNCNQDINCYADKFRWTEEQIAEVSEALVALSKRSAELKAVAEVALPASGMYLRDASLAAAWVQCAHGINRMIDVYGLGKQPRYPEIDSMLYDPKTVPYQRVVQGLALTLQDGRAAMRTFFAPSEKFALELMFLNHRDEAGRFEPLDKGENGLAYAVAAITPWPKYEYSVIVVPGAGGDRPGVPLSPGGKLRNEIAARRWREGRAPYILVSGGFVHPNRTEYAEAIEMKRDLMARFGIPESAILVDPHARHTTTNMRNAARILYRYGVPFDRKALVTTDPSQSAYIEGAVFEKRCKEELGYVPYKILGRTSAFDLEFLPLIESLQSDPTDPLDP